MSTPLGQAPGIIVGVGVGAAAAAALQPAVEIPRQTAWKNSAHKVLDPATMARLVAQGAIELGVAQDAANREGYSDDKLNALVYLAQTVPDLAAAIDLWRKDLIHDDLFRHVLVKAGMDTRYIGPIFNTKLDERLSPEAVALAVIRSALSDADSSNPGHSLLVQPLDTDGGKVPKYVPPAIDAVGEAETSGTDHTRLRTMIASIGLPPSPLQAAMMHFRDIINYGDFNLSALQSDFRPEWAPYVYEFARQILTAEQAAELQLRGFLDRDSANPKAITRLSLTRAHGLKDEHSDLLYDLLGRGINVHQFLIGRRRGGSYGAPVDNWDGHGNAIPPGYLATLQRGNLRPEYYSLAYAGRESYPSAFVARSLLQDHVIDQARGEQLFMGMGWPADIATAAAEHYSQKAAGGGQSHTQKAQTQLWTATHRAYLTGELSDPDATAALEAAGVPASEVPDVLTLWAHEANVKRAILTPAQIKKAYAKGAINPATGVAWTREEAFDSLRERGYSVLDANEYLNLP